MAYALPGRITSVRQQERRQRDRELLAILTVTFIGLMILAVGYKMAGPYFPLAASVLTVGGLAILVKPILGVYLTVMFALAGDAPTSWWYPFTLNLSSRQSILYLHDALTFTPVELYLGLTLVSWLVRVAGSRGTRVHGQPVLLPLLAFAAMLVFGVLYGVFLRGGNLTIAIWEGRPMFYVPILFLLTSNLFTRTAHYAYLAVVSALALFVHDLLAIRYYWWALDASERAELESLTEHAASVHYNWLYLLLLGLVFFRGGSKVARRLLLVVAIPTAYVTILSQRRAGIVALGVGFLIFALVLFYRRRTAFFALVPAVLLVTAGYTAAFWNSTGGVGFGAQAVKTIIAPSEVDEADASSNVYREIENYNLVYTVRTEPVTGVGFGRPFLQPIRLPDISFFVFYEYIPHNSVLWVWLKTGYLGFVAMLTTLALTLRSGMRAALTLPSGSQLALTVGSLGYVAMYFVFAYVDISWDARSTLFLATSMAACVNMSRLSDAERAEAEAAGDTDRDRARRDGPPRHARRGADRPRIPAGVA